MSNLSNPIEDVRVIKSKGPLKVEWLPERSAAEEVRAQILDTAEEKLRQGLELITEGLEWFGLLAPAQHRNLPTQINQQLEQLAEYRRVKS